MSVAVGAYLAVSLGANPGVGHAPIQGAVRDSVVFALETALRT